MIMASRLFFTTLGICFCLSTGLGHAAATSIPPPPQPFRQQEHIAALSAELTAIMEAARTSAAAADFSMGQIHDMAFGLRFPLAVADTLAAALDTLAAPGGDPVQRKAGLQFAHIILTEQIEGVRAWWRTAFELKTTLEKQGSFPEHHALLERVSDSCVLIGRVLEGLNSRTSPSRYTAPVTTDTLVFFDEAMATAIQQQRKVFIDALATDKEHQTFLGGSLYQKISGLRFPLMTTVRQSFYLERLFEGTADMVVRQTSIRLGQTIIERNILTLRQHVRHLEAIQQTTAAQSPDQRLTKQALECVKQTLALLESTLGRLFTTPLEKYPVS